MAISAKLRLGTSGALLIVGTGAPGFTAPKGSIYLKSDGTDAVLYENRGGGSVWTIPGGTGGGGTSTPIASSTVSGTVKTNTDNADPVVYRKSEVDAAFAPTTHTHAASDVVSGVLAIGRIPTGSTGTTVALGNDARLSDARTPTAHAASHATGAGDPITPASIGAAVAGAAPAAHKASHQLGGSDALNVGGLSGVLADPQPPIIGAGATSAVAGNDARLTNARTPTAHAATHATGGGDAITPAAIGASATGHTHVAGDISSGTFAIGLIPTGTTGTTVALGNHTHTGVYSPVGHTHVAGDITSGTFGTGFIGTGTPAAGKYVDGGTGAWTTLPASSAPVTSVFTRTGAVVATTGDYTAAQVGAAATAHTHVAGDIISGTLAIGLIPTGTTGTTVALGNHLHTGVYAPATHTHAESDITNLVTDLAGKEPIRLQTRLTANAATIGTTATTVLTLALAAGVHYRFHAVILYVCTVTTATLAARAAYSGTLGATASGQSMFKVYGSSGVPTVWAAAAKENTQAVNAAMATATGGPGAVGSAAVAMLEVEGTIFTSTAGNLTIPIVSSVAAGITPQADSHLEAWVMT